MDVDPRAHPAAFSALSAGATLPRILLVDDRPQNLLALEATLEPLGHVLVRATSGDQALKKLLEQEFALILMDVQMPDLDGFQTARFIRAHRRTAGIPIIFISATSRDRDQVFEGYSHGAVDYLLKPFDPQILQSKVSIFVELYQRGQQLKVQARLLREHEVAAVERKSEQRYRRLTEAMPLAMWAARPDGAVYYCNRAWSEYSGLTCDRVGGLIDSSVVHPEDIDGVRAAWAQSMADGRLFEVEYRLRRRDGEYLWHLGRGVPEKDEGGAIEGWIVTATDIDAQKRAESVRRQLFDHEHRAREQADAANLAKDEFLATLSHEIRTPLNAILGWSNMLRAGKLDAPTSARALVIIERNAQAQARLIEDLLDVSRIVTGKIRLDVRPLDLRALIKTAAESVQPLATGKQICVELELDSDAGPHSGDPTRLQQIVGNLLTNAVKFGRQGGHVRIVLQRVGSHIEIRVSDDGQGIRADFLPHIFDRFRQADGRTTRSHGGLGLGLAIVRHLVELHGGTVRAESQGADRGAVFVVRLPSRRTSQAGMRAVDHPGKMSDRPDLRGADVLVVDDELDARELLMAVLGHCGANVRAVASSNEALAMIAQGMPDVLVSDIGMPGDDGYTLIQKVRAFAAAGDLPAIAVTAYAAAADRTRALRAGFQSHLSKPVEPSELAFAVANLLPRAS